MARSEEGFWYSRYVQSERDRALMRQVLVEAEATTKAFGADIGSAFLKGALSVLPALQQSSPNTSDTRGGTSHTPRPQVHRATSHRLKELVVLNRKKKIGIVAAVLAVFAISASAIAALIVWSGGDNSVSGFKLETASQAKALTFALGTPVPDLVAGTTKSIPIVTTNANPNSSVTPLSYTVTLSTPTTPSCATSLSYIGGMQTGSPIIVGGTRNDTLDIAAAANTPASCGGVGVSARIVATTAP